MLVMDVRELSGDDRAYAHFWNHLHTIESAIAGVKLGLWLRNDWSPPATNEMATNGTLVELGWPAQGDGFSSARYTLEVLDELDWQSVVAVALARFELPERVHTLLRQRLGYSATIDGQVSGWWSREDDEVRNDRPTGALLPEQGRSLASGSESECLVLVDVDDWWAVLSTLGLGSYSFGLRLEAGETLRFISDEPEQRRWSVRRIEDVADPELLRDRWGDEAARRARAGVSAVRVAVAAE